MKAELIAVGTEILTGQITNTNAQFLSEKLAELGIDVYFHTAVGDNENRLLSVLDQASQRSDLVILCGGLGPTEDDLTKQTLAKFLGKELVFDEEASKNWIVSLLLVLNTHERLIMNVKRKLLRGLFLTKPDRSCSWRDYYCSRGDLCSLTWSTK